MPVVPKGHHRLFRDLSLTVYSRMESAKWKDCAQRDQSYVVRLLLCLLMSPNYPGGCGRMWANNDYQLRSPPVSAPGPTRPGSSHREP